MGLLALFSSNVQAAFHLMWIREVLTQAEGDPRIQFIEFEMISNGQNRVGSHTVEFYGPRGGLRGEFEIPENVPNGSAGDRILFATEDFAAAAGVEPDFVLPDGLIDPFGGRICFETVDCIAYGDFVGSNEGYGSPAAQPPVGGTQSLLRVRTDDPADNSTDYELADPTPVNNAGDAGSLDGVTKECFIEDDFTNLDNWDVPDDGAGLDLEACGIPAVVDIGTIESEANELLLFPAAEDVLGLGNPIGFASMNSEAAALVIDESDESYRIQFDVRADAGIVSGAVFVHQHNEFSDGIFDPSLGGGGMGLNFTIGCHREDTPKPCPDSVSDHFHPDVRGLCIAEGGVTFGPGEAKFTDLDTLEPETDYTMIFDVDGDDVNGPLTLLVKAFPAGDPEPKDYTNGWQLATGLGADDDPDLDRLILLAALRAGSVDPGPALRFSSFSVCEIPRNQKHVRFLSCVREGGDDVLVQWDNPFDAPVRDIEIRVDGQLVDTVGGDDTEYVLSDAPEGEFVVSVRNFSGVEESCVVCQNDPPEVVIEVEGELVEGKEPELFFVTPAELRFDSSQSSDPDGGELIRFWEVLEFPPEADPPPFIEDPSASELNLSLEWCGRYTFALTISDEGCDGDPEPLATTVEFHVFMHDLPPPNLFRRGDCNSNGGVDLSDAIFFLNFLFLGGEMPICAEACNTNADANGDLSDAVALLNFLFLGGASPPAPGPDECGDGPMPLGCELPDCV